MKAPTVNRNVTDMMRKEGHRRSAFTLVELLTVVFIISLLIAILVPSLSAARTQAKRTASAQTIKAIEAGLEMFRQDNESDFARTNGYPPSYSYPGRFSKDDTFDRYRGQFPFYEKHPTVYGAMWLPAMLMGVDKLGYIAPGSVPNKNDLRAKPEEWYKPAPLDDTTIEISRSPFYLDPDVTRSLKLRDVPGRPPEWWLEGGDWGPVQDPQAVQNMVVLVDSFDYPILYYAANRSGRRTNIVGEARNPQNEYTGGVQQKGPPFFFHDDNEPFTGHGENGTIDLEGWDFDGEHPLADTGAALNALEIADEEREMNFARYVIDRKQLRDLKAEASPNPNTPLRPVNSDSFLLISPGPDGKYGTVDDVSNLPPFLE